jgi:hypothetical protein
MYSQTQAITHLEHRNNGTTIAGKTHNCSMWLSANAVLWRMEPSADTTDHHTPAGL